MYIKITNIDSKTKILCTEKPMINGPDLPKIKGFEYIFSNESIYPIDTNQDGSYAETPIYYGICDNDADISLTGVLGILTEEEYNLARQTEHQARKPYLSWIGDIYTMSWQPPIPYPDDNKRYIWEEETLSWKEYVQ